MAQFKLSSPLLSKEERELFQQLHEERLHDSKTFSKPSYKGIWTGIVDKYKEKAHFVYELLQNADDAQATEACFILEKDRLIFRHNGQVGFSVSREDDIEHKGHINAITGVGNSTKNETSGNTIGKFGVGFKAVFQYTAVPHIYDDKFWFKIDNYIIPTALDTDFADRKKGETVFVFPFFSPQAAYNEITERLKTLDNPILFLRHLKNVKIDTPENKGIEYSKTVLERHQCDSVSHELLQISNYGEIVKIHMFTQQVTINNEGKNYTQYISAGYFLDTKGNLDVSKERKVFCFFPTAESFKLKCVVHAPFLLVDSRQQLKNTTINTRLKKLLSQLAAKALVILRDYGIQKKSVLINENIFSIVPECDNFYSYSEDIFREDYLNIIRENSLLLARGDKYVSKDQALICRPISMMNILTDKQLSDLKAGEYDEDDEPVDYFFLREETQKIYTQHYVESILDDLGITVFNGESLAKRLSCLFMESYGLKWAKRLYAHLRNEQVGLWKRPENSKKAITETPFCLSPIILTSDGSWRAPYRITGVLDVYLPLANAAEGYTFISNEYLKDKDSLSFLKDLGIKEPNAWDYINSVVLKKYSERGTINQESIVGDFEIIYEYLNKCKTTQERNDVVSILREKYTLVCLDHYLRSAGKLYEDNSSLSNYFNNAKEKFVNTKYYQDFIDKYSIQEFNSFIRLLGVVSVPKLLQIPRNYISYEEKVRFGIQEYTWLKMTDYQIDGFEDWHPQSIVESKSFWQWLSLIYKDQTKHKIECRYQYYKYYTKYVDAGFINQVKTRSWIVSDNGTLKKPSEISLEFLEKHEFLIDYDLIKLFGIERQTKSLKELGASENQIEQNEKGKLAEKYGLETEEDFKEAMEALREKRERERAKKEPKDTRKENPKNSNGDNTESPTNPKMRNTSLDDMSSSEKDYNHGSKKVEKSTDERVQDITQKLADEANKKIEEENKRAQVSDLTKYSKVWFETLLDLEYNSSLTETEFNRGQIKITFEKFHKELGSSQIYVLSNPSRNIPIWVEEIGGLSVKFTFLNKDDLSITFDVANVKDFTLRLKAKAGDVRALDSIDWSKCTKAIVEVNNPVEIMNRLKSAFSSLDYEPEYNFCDNLTNNISFVFGPPGTGKTTRLAEIISSKMERPKCRILVLAPTNKACDVLTSKLMDNNDDYCWLGRFVATGDEEIEAAGVVVDRESNLWNNDHCCIVSTIARLPYDGFIQSTVDGGLLKDIDWDFVIIDEASMIPLVQIVYAIYKMDKTKFIIAGDPLQISPIVKEKGWIGENIYTMVRLNNFENPTTIPLQFDVEKLGTQYRSVPSIGSLYSNYSYNGKLVHNRTEKDLKNLPFGDLKLKPLSFVPFPVERFDSIFGAKKLNGSNVHIYSAIFSVEMCSYVAKQQTSTVKIGVICPYAPQAQLINKMIEQRTDLPNNVSIQCGTIHGFQGDQCEIIFTVLNPPTGIKAAADRIMLNNKNVLNVAISRASDYLIVLLPHPDSYGYENLIEINKLCKLAKNNKKETVVINSDAIEKTIFGSRNYLETNTFVTTHQLANVYSQAAGLYEVRIDDHSVDIQLAGESYSSSSMLPVESHSAIENDSQDTETIDEKQIEESISSNEQVEEENIESSDPELSLCKNDKLKKYMEQLESGKPALMGAVEYLHSLVLDSSEAAIYTALQLVGNSAFCRRYFLSEYHKVDISKALKKLYNSPFNVLVAGWLHAVNQKKKCPFKNYTHLQVSSLSFEEFETIYQSYKTKLSSTPVRKSSIVSKQSVSPKKVTNSVTKVSRTYIDYIERKKTDTEDKLYDRFEYGLSDW